MANVINALKALPFIGRITQPAKLRTVQVQGQDRQVLNLNLAVNEWRAVRGNPKGEEIVSWVNIALWGDEAVRAAQMLMVADELSVTNARIHTDIYVGKDGEHHFSFQAKGGHVQFIFRRNLTGEYHPVDPDHYVDPSKRAAAKAAAETAPTVNDADMALFQEFLAAKKAAESGPIELDPEPEPAYSISDEPF